MPADGSASGSMLRPYKASPIASLSPYEGNARTHSEAQVEQIAESIRAFGFTNPVLVDELGRVIAGHGRLLAARLLGWTEVPTLELSGLTDAQRRALVLADNKLALNAEWNLDQLRLELAALRDEDGFDLDVIGFSPEELADLFTVLPAGGDPDAAPPLPNAEDAISVEGDVWTLGPHRLVVGDGREQGVWDALMGTERADICWVDPPYNVDYHGKAGSIENDSMSSTDFRQFLHDLFVGAFQALKPGGAIYVAHADTERANFTNAFLSAGFKLSGVVIWQKDALVLGRSDYQWIHEPILYGWKPGGRHRWFGGRKNTTVASLGPRSPFTQLPDGRWQVLVDGKVLVVEADAKVEEVVPSILTEPRPRSSDLHPTMKPVALIERQLIHNARAGDIVVDFCAGSGSTLIAADRLGMVARVIELDKRYADVIVRRWQDLTGRKATRADGTEFGS